jgi:hypothetical protein
MRDMKKGLGWGAAILLNGVGNYFGLIDDKVAETLFIVLPIVAVTTMGWGCCSLAARREA